MATALSIDLYELTMAAGYFCAGHHGRATFEASVRQLPPNRGFLVAAGLEQVLAYLEGLRFTQEQIEYLRTVPALKDVPADFFDRYLPNVRFTGDVWAVPEGVPVFPPAPMLELAAPIVEAQLAETAILATLTFQTSIASKAARVVAAAQGRPVIEFGGRRAHGTEAAMYAARAAVIGGCEGTSNLEAGLRFGIPVSGTMAHSWVMAHETELEAFQSYAALYGERAVLLLDTFDTIKAAHHVVRSGLRPSAVRLDSGDIAELSRAVRAIFDNAGLPDTKIFVSGDLDESRIAALLASGAPVDAFGVGTALSTSIDAPALGGIYKLVEIERAGQPVPVMKLSPGKHTYPGRKQVWRIEQKGTAARDVVGIMDEAGPAGGRPLLDCVMRNGRRTRQPEPIGSLRDRSLEAIGHLPVSVRRLAEPSPYPVVFSDALEALATQVAGNVAR